MMKARRSKNAPFWHHCNGGREVSNVLFILSKIVGLISSCFVTPHSLPHTTTALPKRLEIAPRGDHHKFYLPALEISSIEANFSELPNVRK